MTLPPDRPLLHNMTLPFNREALSIENVSMKLFRPSFIDTRGLCRVYPSGIIPTAELSLLSSITSPDGRVTVATVLRLPVMLQVKRRGSVEHTPPSPHPVSLKLAITESSASICGNKTSDPLLMQGKASCYMHGSNATVAMIP